MTGWITTRWIFPIDKTMREVWDILKANAYREQDAAMLVGPFQKGLDLDCIIKFMYTTDDGRRFHNELLKGKKHVQPGRVHFYLDRL